MTKLLQLLYAIIEMLKLLKDTDGDGRPDIFDKYPNDPAKK